MPEDDAARGAWAAERLGGGRLPYLVDRAAYLALQWSADYGDDASLDLLSQQLGEIMRATGLGLVAFCAGLAPWHDDPACLRRLLARLPRGRARLLESAELWDLCALLAHARVFVGSSLHGRIVAAACGVPRISLRHPVPAARPAKLQAWVDSWEVAGLPGVVALPEVAAAVAQALAADRAALLHQAQALACRYRQSFAAPCRRLDG